MTWEYIAGFFDGEGWVAQKNHARQNYQVAMSQHTRAKKVLYEIQHFLADQGIDSVIYNFAKRKTRTKHSPMHGLYISRASNVQKFLINVLPLLIVKHHKAKILLATAQRYIKKEAARLQRIPKAADQYLQGDSCDVVCKKFRTTWPLVRAELSRRGVIIPLRGRNQNTVFIPQFIKQSPVPPDNGQSQ